MHRARGPASAKPAKEVMFKPAGQLAEGGDFHPATSGDLSLAVDYLRPQQNLVSKVRDGAKATKRNDTATHPTPTRHQSHKSVSDEDKAILEDTYQDLNQASVRRQIQDLTEQSLKLTTNKKSAPTKHAPTRASTNESPGIPIMQLASPCG